MKKYCLGLWIIIAMSPLLAQSSQIYKWTDSSGSVHFSDKPHPGAEEIELPAVQTYSAPKMPAQPIPPTPIVEEEETTGYEKLKIVQPEDQATIRNPQGFVSVLVDMQPKLKRGDKLQLLYDGSPVAEPQISPVFALQNITRGSHTLSAQILNGNGNVLASTEPITIYMMPPRVNMVPQNNQVPRNNP